ncbi:amino acid ABC transporter permease [Campylobacter sp. MIT 21-1685]|uniref:amino acid ABC transporter permease n=1 Tax=unclassified Campylobacter TaxID=2593542 RepID=UPI00224AA3F0|nr:MULTISPECIES: amino acid ABC transporter permease [unclassified Campylobacter]MCX2682530.1 amino acid ABC transporter permease [Campylobacter sp. MIT 21-1684]MCX2750757.1 amino acid ABC transporter permease [Campylobacter sp. MIT 21-1682]MCX2807011.1 amino acid ABC transporter permease [Campylobacter sp. MIT 21-1685]
MFDFEYFFSVGIKLLPGIPMTFFLAISSCLIGGVFALIFALIRLYKIPLINAFVVIYISFFRGTPLLVQLFMFFYGIPLFLQSFDLQFDFVLIDAIYYALVIFSCYACAYLSEIFRAAFLSVDKGQIEAAYSLGMTSSQVLIRIILPQSFMITLPNLLNFFILQVKNTALASIITVTELMGLADIESGRSSKFLEVYLMAALMYWFLCIFLETIFFKTEKYFAKFRRKVV